MQDDHPSDLAGASGLSFAERTRLISELEIVTRHRNELLERIAAITQLRVFGSPPRAMSDWDLVGLLPINVKKRVFINGFPGAGNLITQQLCYAILGDHGSGAPVTLCDDIQKDGLPNFLDFIGPRHDAFMRTCKSALPPQWSGTCYLQHRGMGSLDFVAVDSKRFLLLTELDCGIHLNFVAHSTHEYPFADRYRTFGAIGFSVMPVVRHPLDLLVSFGSKGALNEADHEIISSLEGDPAAGRREIARRYRQFACRVRLGDEVWLSGIADAMLHFHEPIVATAREWPPVRYEDILEDPKGTVERLAKRLGVELIEERAIEISRMIGRKEFSPGHFNAPSIGKWRPFFNRDQIDQLRSMGVFELFGPLGYPEPEAHQTLDQTIDQDTMRAQLCAAVPGLLNAEPDPIWKYQYLVLAHTFDPLDHAARFALNDRMIHSARHGTHLLISNDKEFLDVFSHNLVDVTLAAIAGNQTDCH